MGTDGCGSNQSADSNQYSNRSMRLMTEGDRLDDQADGIYLQAVAEGTKKGLPFGP